MVVTRPTVVSRPTVVVVPTVAVADNSWREYLCTRDVTSLAKVRTGSANYAVTVLQSALKELGWYQKRVDGSFGPITAEAVRGFQGSYGLVVDGRVGPQTWSALQAVSC